MTEIRSDLRLSPRERMVLTAIIEMYIATGEPVASQALARTFADREGLSSATLRNVMAVLGDNGLLEQAHTSAGRIPTAAAFRYYVEQITQSGQLAAGQKIASSVPQGPQTLSDARRGQIEETLTGVTSSHEYLERTSHLLALISSGLGVALASATEGQVLEHIHFSRLSTGRVLAVLVTQSGAVQDRVLVLDHELTHLELETAARYLNENFRGWPVERIRAEVARRRPPDGHRGSGKRPGGPPESGRGRGCWVPARHEGPGHLRLRHAESRRGTDRGTAQGTGGLGAQGNRRRSPRRVPSNGRRPAENA